MIMDIKVGMSTHCFSKNITGSPFLETWTKQEKLFAIGLKLALQSSLTVH